MKKSDKRNEPRIEAELPSHAEEAIKMLQHLIALRVKLCSPKSRQDAYAEFVKEFPPVLKSKVNTVEKAIEFVDFELWTTMKAIAETGENRVSLLVAYNYIEQIANTCDSIIEGKLTEEDAFQKIQEGLLGGE